MAVTGVECHPRSRDYAWEPMRGEGLSLVSVAEGVATGVNNYGDFGAALEATLAGLNPDVVAIPGWSSREALIALRWCYNLGVPVVLMSESCAHDEPRWAWKEWIKRRVVDCSSTALVGGSLHRAYLKRLGLAEDKITLGYDVVDNAFFAEEAERHRDKEGLESTGNFLASARFIEKKNLRRLVDAYAAYHELAGAGTAPPWTLTLLGDGPLRPALEKQVRDLALTDAVSMPGFLQYKDLPTHYARASAFIHASTTEQWGLVVNEAMASGLPVLVSNRCGCVPDLIHEGKNGATFDPFTTEAITQAMVRMAALPPAKLGEQGRLSQEIIRNWGPDRFGCGLLESATKALQERRKRPSIVHRTLVRLLSMR